MNFIVMSIINNVKSRIKTSGTYYRLAIDHYYHYYDYALIIRFNS